jgi:hypothetical protein
VKPACGFEIPKEVVMANLPFASTALNVFLEVIARGKVLRQFEIYFMRIDEG